MADMDARGGADWAPLIDAIDRQRRGLKWLGRAMLGLAVLLGVFLAAVIAVLVTRG